MDPKPKRARFSFADAALLAAAAAAPAASSSSAPPWIRGSLLAHYNLKEALAPLIRAAMASVAAEHGFHAAPQGAVEMASDLLLSQLCGGGGPAHAGPPEAIAALHECVFENYNNWALMVGGRCVYSARLAPPRLSEAQLAGPGAQAARAAAAAAAAAAQIGRAHV